MAPDRTKRKLAAIFAADIVGYSQLMGVDEEDTRHQIADELADHDIPFAFFSGYESGGLGSRFARHRAGWSSS